MGDMPPVTRCFGMFPPKYACYLISLVGLGMGVCGIVGIILFSLVEDAILSYFMTPEEREGPMEKVILLTLGITSLMLLIANALLFLGVTASNRGFVSSAKWVLLVLCLIILVIMISLPVVCFFMENACIIKKMMPSTIIIVYLFLAVFVEFWMYFMVVVANLEQEM